MKNLWLARQSVPQICFGSYFQKGKIFRFGKESIFPFRENHPLSEDTKIKLSLCMLLVFGASKNVSFNNNNHVSKLFAKGFENLSSSFFFFGSKNLLYIEYWAAHVAAFILPIRKFHSDIDNKMADNNGFALLHQTDFDISNDHFCWNDIFIRWFEDYQLPTIAYGSNSFSSSLCICSPVLNGRLLFWEDSSRPPVPS